MPISDYLVTIGLEVHCQIKTKTKMFCNCRAGFGYEPNTSVCPTCLGMPGALPVLNEFAIERTLLTGLMLGCRNPKMSQWDRKNYFYADMPKNYQTTQMDFPLCLGGEVPLYSWAFPKGSQEAKNCEGPIVRMVKLEQIHLEEDAGKLTHYSKESLVDYNRAGTPLMELVSAPDMHTPDECYAYLKSLQQIFIMAGISDADMEKGQMRCDVNVSLLPIGEVGLGAKIEMKNINSTSAARRSLIYEISRQADELDRGIEQKQSTRRWDDDRGESIVMRSKENAHDYRYHTCPDLAPIHTAPILERVKALIPELPDALQQRLIAQYQLHEAEANAILTDMATCRYFEAAASASKIPRKVANWIINKLSSILSKKDTAIADCPLSPQSFAGLVDIVEEGIVSANQAMEVLEVLWLQPERLPSEAAASLGYKKTDTDALDSTIDEVIINNPKEVELVKGGNTKLINFLTGQVMKASNPKPNPKIVTGRIAAKLGL